MKNVIFLGPPGCGKGTQVELITTALGYIRISTGDLLREIAKQSNPFASKIRTILASGELVSNEIVNELIDDFYVANINKKDVILDGYPRSIEQAEALEKLLAKRDTKINFVFYFDLPEDILVKRVTGRYSCAKCGTIYNRFFYNTKVDGKCDKCDGVQFEYRSDDSEETIVERLRVYNTSTSALLEYYKDCLVKIDASQAPELVAKEIIAKLENS